jgi:tetratricopeptide (TPR) repeat protein
MLDPYSPIKQAFSHTKQRMPTLNIIEQKSFTFLKIVLIIFAIIFIIFITFWIINKDESYVVQPFQTVGFGQSMDGKSLATLLSFNLQKIKNTYEPGPKITINPLSGSSNMIIPRPLGEFSTTNLSIESAGGTPMEYSVSQIGTLGAVGASISLGNMLLSMKEFLGHRANTITCSLQRYNSSIVLIAILEDHQASDSGTITFEEEANISKEEQIPSLIKDLAFMIALDLSKRNAQHKGGDLYPQTWLAFKYLTYGRNAYNNYINMKNINYTNKINYLKETDDMAVLATKVEPGYKGSFDLLSGLGFAYLEMGLFDDATKTFKNISGVKPFESALGLGLVHGMQDNYAEALEAFDNATQLNPKSAEAWNYKGVILSKQRNYTEAVKAFSNTTMLNEQYATAWKYKGDALAHLGHTNHSKYDEAIQAYDRAIEINPLFADAWKYKGIVLYNQGKLDESIQAFNRAIELNQSDPGPWIYKANALERLNKYDESIKARQNASLIKK